jgi:phage shock protein C
MQSDNSNVFTRDDTFFGVCQAIGDDLGFSPNWLRAAFGVMLIYAPVATIGAYLALGVAVLALRLLVPNPRAARVDADQTAEPAAAAAGHDAVALAAAA